MPTYYYVCEKGHKSEVKAGYEVTTIACLTCGRDARRLSVYETQYINGETVAKGVMKAGRSKEAL